MYVYTWVPKRGTYSVALCAYGQRSVGPNESRSLFQRYMGGAPEPVLAAQAYGRHRRTGGCKLTCDSPS